ncbi:MAG TPA: RcnB family protein [Noviherbaspirillum sp.]|nr:RcnB family protein [Noviherbaspirillum sp.]
MRKLLATVALVALGVVSNNVLAQHGEHDEHAAHGRHGMERGHGNVPPRPNDHDFRSENDRRGFDHPEHFRRGQRLPPEYRSHQFVVEDWRHYRLPPPPRGHHWVQVGAEYVLVAIPSGVIINVVVMP